MNAPAASLPPRAGAVEHVDVIIVGSGFAGLGMAIALQRRGGERFVVLERADAIGGTWRDNHYPGCACDVPSFLYSFSFAPNVGGSGWSRVYAPQAEIRAYLEGLVDTHQLRPHVRFGAELTQARWDAAAARWVVTTADGRTFVGGALVLALGGLSRPAMPTIPGLDDFEGTRFHSAAWDHAAPLDGRRVGVIGTGASAIQFVPPVAERAGQLTVFQRSAPWILPKSDRPFSPLERRALAGLPGAAAAYRAWIYGTQELRALAFTEGAWMMRLGRAMALRHLHAQVRDPALRAKLTPDYAMGCKRVLISNDYYPALTRPNVHVETGAIARVVPRGVETRDGRLHPLDVLILGTGFAVHDYVGRADVRGVGGASLAETWRRGAEAYLGTTVPGFPNLFVLVGPNTGLAHTSMVFMIESQIGYVLGALAHRRRAGVAALDLRPEVSRRYNDAIAARLDGRVWSSGCSTWYRDASGRNSTLWPGFTFEFRARTAHFDAASYLAAPRHGEAR